MALQIKVKSNKKRRPLTSDSCGADPAVLADVSNNENAPSISKKINLESVFALCACELDWRNITDGSRAAIVSAFLTDMGFVSADDTSSAIDRMKIRRERLKMRNKFQKENYTEVKAFFFDGRKHKTKKIIKDEGTGSGESRKFWWGGF